MMFIGLVSWTFATAQTLGGGSLANALGPNCASRLAASSPSRPRSGSTWSSVAASSADRPYQATSWI